MGEPAPMDNEPHAGVPCDSLFNLKLPGKQLIACLIEIKAQRGEFTCQWSHCVIPFNENLGA